MGSKVSLHIILVPCVKPSGLALSILFPCDFLDKIPFLRNADRPHILQESQGNLQRKMLEGLEAGELLWRLQDIQKGW